MRKFSVLGLAVLASLICAIRPALADDIPVSIGNKHFTDGNKITTGAYLTAVAGQPAPFGAFCGSDPTGPNCSATWTFPTYTIPAGDTITAATLTLGIFDIDSAAPGNQVASYTLNGGDDLTALLNTAAEGVNGGAGSPNSFYNVLTISIPMTDFTALEGGTATIALTLQGPGLGILGSTTFNGAGLDFSTLDITAEQAGGGGGGTPMPEPASLLLLSTGLVGLGAKLRLRK